MKEKSKIGGSVELEFEYGNSYKFLPAAPNSLKHLWKAFFRLKDTEMQKGIKIENIVDTVYFELDRFYNKPSVFIKEPPYELQNKSFGQSVIQITVFFKPVTGIFDPVQLFHTLIFQASGDTQKLKLIVSNEAC